MYEFQKASPYEQKRAPYNVGAQNGEDYGLWFAWDKSVEQIVSTS